MSIEFQAYNDFLASTIEANLLINFAEVNESESDLYQLYNKLSILLMMSKLECYFEHLIDEYIEKIEEMNICHTKLPKCMIYEHSENYLNEIQNDFKKNKLIEIEEKLQKISAVLKPGSVNEKLKICSKFNYGKHGSKEIIKLFKKIGITNIFDVVKIYEEVESLLDDMNEKIEIDIANLINEYTNHRNNIMHEDKTPNITHIANRYFCNQMQSFCDQTQYYLKSKLIEMNSSSLTNI